MQLKHIEHPEDTILTGDLSAINWFTLQGKVSLKIDGCPAIVWGTNPCLLYTSPSPRDRG